MLTESKADGACAIEPVLAPRATIAHAKPADAGMASLAVIRECAGGFPSTGGVARFFGEQ